jgi:ribokinase
MAHIDVAVLGSINLDVVIGVAAFPKRGQTIMSGSVVQTSGGKGANQAIAAARMGVRVAMIGAVGDDEAGRMLTGVLEANGVDISAVERLEGELSGVAHVIVDRRGENMIMVHSGANGRVTPEQAAYASPAKVCLAQLETPIEAVDAFLKHGGDRGSICILNTAPAVAGAEVLFKRADILVLNETELASYAGKGKDLIARARGLIARPGQNIVVTLGGEGARVVSANWELHVPTPSVKVIDTTGAGDCFCGVLAASISRGAPLAEAVSRANTAAAIAVTRAGAALATPSLAELDAFGA